MSAANIGPNLFYLNRTVSWQISAPRPKSSSSTLRSDSGYRMYIITAMRIISGDELKHRNGLAGSLIWPIYQAPVRLSRLL
jgi:hypothetical protein